MPTYGPFTATAFSNTGSSAVGTTDTYGTVQDDDGPTASVSNGSPAGFVLSGFGFAIPSDETVVGIEVAIRARSPWGVLPPPPYYPLRAAVLAGSSGAPEDTADQTTTSFQFFGLGGPTSLMGLTPSPSDINDPSFGVGFDTTGSVLAAPLPYEIDLVEVTIYTELPDPQDDFTEGYAMTTRYIDDVVTFWAQFSDASGAATDATGSPAYAVYEEMNGTAILSGTLSVQDNAGTTGFYSGQITASAANGFEVGKSYVVRVSATVATVDQGKIVAQFVIRQGIGDTVWATALPSDSASVPSTFGAAVKRILSKLQNRMTKSGNVVSLYADDNTTVIASSGYSLTGTGFDRSKDQ